MGGFRAFGGYRDNVLLSSFFPEGSVFLGESAEFILWQPIGEHTMWETFLTADHRHYLSVLAANPELTVLLTTELKRDWGENWQGLAGVEYVYLHQVMDLSATQVQPFRTIVEGQTLSWWPAARRKLGTGWLQLGLPVRRQWYAAPLDNYWELQPELAYEWPWGKSFEMDASYSAAFDWYDNETLRAPDGSPLPGTRREMWRHDLRLSARTYWDERRRWRTDLRVAGLFSQDTGPGYYDYVRPRIGARLRYRAHGWEFAGGIRATYYDYTVQTVSLEDPDHRFRSELTVDLRCQRQIASSFFIFAEYAYEKTYSNRPEDRYHVNTLTFGLNAEF